MAQKRKASRIDDTQRSLLIRSAQADTSCLTIHLPDMLMRANRRQYTQCRAYDFRLKVANITSSTEQHYEVYTLSNAWWVKRAIEMAKGVYMEATKEERAILGNKKAKYHDFIISLTSGAASNKSNLFQFAPAGSGDDMTAAEVAFDESIYETFQVSKLKDDDGDFMGFTVGNEDTTSDGAFNIFNQYLLATSITPDADTRAGPYAELQDIDEDSMNDLQQSGDQTPWDADAFPSPFVLQDVISIDQSLPTGGPLFSRMITAPLGIIILKKRNNSAAETNFGTDDQLLLECRKGTYRGVHAPAYKAMNGVLGK